jgi:hypothetical protein
LASASSHFGQAGVFFSVLTAPIWMFLLSLGGSPSYALKSRIFITPHIDMVSDNKKSLPTIPKDSRQAI